jgi:hypothetical protein
LLVEWYYTTAGARGFPVSNSLVAFWLAAAVVMGSAIVAGVFSLFGG